MKNKIKIINVVKFIKLSKFIQLNGATEYKIKKIKPQNDEQDLILITAPDGNLFVNLRAYHNWCVMNQHEIQIEFVPAGITFISANLYAELTGYTVKAIERKFEDKIWEPSILFRSPDGELLINVSKVESWIISKYINGGRR
ncbi:MAG: hypothetical protein E6Q32_05025 [Neisseriales bacterium]|nr:MAG: hypothetical protein E6Q32_05025 [Neisseriales bacterium]